MRSTLSQVWTVKNTKDSITGESLVLNNLSYLLLPKIWEALVHRLIVYHRLNCIKRCDGTKREWSWTRSNRVVVKPFVAPVGWRCRGVDTLTALRTGQGILFNRTWTRHNRKAVRHTNLLSNLLTNLTTDAEVVETVRLTGCVPIVRVVNWLGKTGGKKIVRLRWTSYSNQKN